MHPFEPAGQTTTVSATTTSAQTTVRANHRQLQIANAGGDVVFVAWGVATLLPSGTLTATTSDYPVLPGTVVVVSKGTADTVAVRAGSTSATVYLTPGTGG